MATTQRRPLTALVAIGITAALGGGLPDTATAGGFYTPYQSGTANGAALAGASARTDDASFQFFNPAAIANFTDPTLTISTGVFSPKVTIDASRAISPLGADITAAGNSGSMTGLAVGPVPFVAVPLGKGFTLGIGASAPFAVDIEAQPGWAGRFQLLETKMRGINVSTALAWRLNPFIAFAAGVQAQTFEGRFEKSELLPLPGGLVETRGFLHGEGTAVGPVAGVLISPTPATTLGIGYRSELTHKLTGTAGTSLPFIPIESVKFDTVTPQVVSVGLEHKLTPAIRLFAEAQWVDWSRFKGFDIAFASGRPNELRAQSWDDTFLFALGGAVRLGPTTEVSAGVHYDTAVTSGGANTLSPDGKRRMVGLGLTQTVPGAGRITAHYAHVFFDDVPVTVSSLREGTLEGTFKSSLATLGVTFTMGW